MKRTSKRKKSHLPPSERLIVNLVLTLMILPSLMTLTNESFGDPTLQGNGDGTETATWDFQNPADYTTGNVTVSAGNVTLEACFSGFVDTLQSDFQQGTVSLNMDVANDPGNLTLMDTIPAGMPQWVEYGISDTGGKDAYLNGGSVNRNYGVSINLAAERANQRRPIIEFNLTSLQAYDLITSARIMLELDNSNSAEPLDVSVHQVNASWLEGTGDGSLSGDGVTYRSRDGSVLWNTDGGDFNPVPEDTNYSIQDQRIWYYWDISQLYEDWQNGTKPNYGVIFIPQNPVFPLNEKLFHSKESSTTGSRPRLRLEYIALEGGLANGTFVSRVLDAGFWVNWGNISWKSTVPGQTGLTIETRSGDCSGGWSAWSAAYASPSGSRITSPPNQCIQYKVEMNTFNRTKTPVLEEVRIDQAYTSQGHIETMDFAPGNLVGWETFNANDNSPPDANVTYWFSTDSGVSWTEIFPGGNLQSIPDPKIRFRANLTSSDPRITPMLLNLSVTYQFVDILDHIHMVVSTWTGTTDEWVNLDAIGHDAFHNMNLFIEKWETTDPWGSVDADGVYNPGMVGTWRVYCNNTIDSVSNYTTVNVLPGSTARIEINPWDPGTLTADDLQMFDTLGYDSVGNLIGPVSVNWSVSGGIGSIPIGPSTSGLFNATTPGFGMVIAIDGFGHTNMTNVFQVLEGSLDRIDVQPDIMTVQTGELRSFAAIGYDSDGNTVPLINPVWGSNAGNIINSTSSSATLEAYAWEVLNGWINVVAPFQDNVTGIATLQVLLPNTAPTILGTIPDQLKPEDYGSWSLDLSSYASDSEDSPSTLTWTITGHDSNFITISGDGVQGNHNMTFMTLENVFGSDQLVLWLRDSEGDVDSQTMYINITSVNDRPTIQSIAPIKVHFDAPYQYNFYGYVSDVETATDDLVLTSSDPDHISFNGPWATFDYPEEFKGMTEYPIVTVQDEDGGETSTILTITVSDDHVPELTTELPDVTLYEGEEIRGYFDLDDYFSDPDGDSLLYTSGNIHTEIVIHNNHSVDFIAPDDWYGVEIVCFRAIDTSGARIEDMILLTVLPVNDPPTIEGVPDLYVHYDDSSRPSYRYAFDLDPYIDDVDNVIADLSVTTTDPNHIFFNDTKPTIMEIHYPQSMMGQTVVVRITVSDGLSEAYQYVCVTILDNWPPEIISNIPEYTYFEDTIYRSAFTMGDYFADNDADELTYSSISSNVAVSIDETTFQVDLSATPNWFGYEYVTFVAMDPTGATAEHTLKITVLPVNDAPEIHDIPVITLQVGERYAIDLGEWVSDIDNSMSDLTVSISGGNATATIAGFILVLDYPESGTDRVQVEVSDGDLTTYGYLDVRIVSPPISTVPVWDQIYWPWSLVVAILALIISFIFVRRFLAKIHIDEAFLLYQDGRPIHHSVAGEQTGIDEDAHSSILTAVQEFIRDSSKEGGDSRVRRIKVGDSKIAVGRGESTYLAVVYMGHENSRNLRPIREAIEEIEGTYARELDDWDGVTTGFSGVGGVLQKHLGVVGLQEVPIPVPTKNPNQVIEEMQVKLDFLERQFKEKQEEAARVERALGEMQLLAQRSEDAEERATFLEGEMEKAKALLAERKKQLEEREKEIAEKEKALEEKNTELRQVEESQSRITELEENLKQRGEELKVATQAVQEAQEMQIKLDFMERQLEEKKQEMASMGRALEEAQLSAQKSEDVEDRAAFLEGEMKKAKALLAERKEQLEKNEREIAEKEKALEEMNTLLNQVAAFQSRITELEEELKKTGAEAEERVRVSQEVLERQTDISTQKISELKIQVKTLQEQLEEEVKKAVDERDEIKTLNEEIIKDWGEVKHILKILDDLLEKLPDDEIEKFSQSDAFKLYEKILDGFEIGDYGTGGQTKKAATKSDASYAEVY